MSEQKIAPVLSDDEINELCWLTIDNTSRRAVNDREMARGIEQAVLARVGAPAQPVATEAVPAGDIVLPPLPDEWMQGMYREIDLEEFGRASVQADRARRAGNADAVPVGESREDLGDVLKLEMEIGQIGAALGFDPDGDFELEDIHAAIRALKGTPAAAVPHSNDPVPVLAAALALLVAAGFVTQEKADEAIQIALHTPAAAVPRNTGVERKAFEAWAVPHKFNIKPSDDCGYISKTTNAAWLAWGASVHPVEPGPAAAPAADPGQVMLVRVRHVDGEVMEPEIDRTSAWFDALPHGTELILYAAPQAAEAVRTGCGCSDYEQQLCRGKSSPYAEHPECARAAAVPDELATDPHALAMDMLVAAGFVSQAKADEAYSIAYPLAHRAAEDGRPINDNERQALAAAVPAAQPAAITTVPLANCYSNNEGDSWRDCPDDIDFVQDLNVGDEYELQASMRYWTERFRVTKAPDDTNDDYEVEPVDIRYAAAPQAGQLSGNAQSAGIAAATVLRANEVSAMEQADKDGRHLNAQGHQQAINAIDFCISKLAPTQPTAVELSGNSGEVDADLPPLPETAGYEPDCPYPAWVNDLLTEYATATLRAERRRNNGALQALSDIYGLVSRLPGGVPDNEYHIVTAAAAAIAAMSKGNGND